MPLVIFGLHNHIYICVAVKTNRFKLSLSAIFDGSFHLEILKESLLRAIHDIDASFSKVSY